MKYAILIAVCLFVGCTKPAVVVEELTKDEPQLAHMANLPNFMGHEFGKPFIVNNSEAIDGTYSIDMNDDLVESVANFEVVNGVLVSVMMSYSRPSFNDMIAAYSEMAGIAPGKNLQGKLCWKFRNGVMTIDEQSLVIRLVHGEDGSIPSTLVELLEAP